jgi:hypothetical protein
MDSPDKVEGLLRDAEFDSIRVVTRDFEHPMTAENFIALKTSVGRGKQRLDNLSLDERSACIARARDRLEKLPADAFTMKLPVILATARA